MITNYKIDKATTYIHNNDTISFTIYDCDNDYEEYYLTFILYDYDHTIEVICDEDENINLSYYFNDSDETIREYIYKELNKDIFAYSIKVVSEC